MLFMSAGRPFDTSIRFTHLQVGKPKPDILRSHTTSGTTVIAKTISRLGWTAPTPSAWTPFRANLRGLDKVIN